VGLVEDRVGIGFIPLFILLSIIPPKLHTHLKTSKCLLTEVQADEAWRISDKVMLSRKLGKITKEK
jgi:hypothetical protein